jgi:hypothetical protein
MLDIVASFWEGWLLFSSVCADSSAGIDVREGGPPPVGHCAWTVLLLLVRLRTYAEGKKVKRLKVLEYVNVIYEHKERTKAII